MFFFPFNKRFLVFNNKLESCLLVCIPSLIGRYISQIYYLEMIPKEKNQFKQGLLVHVSILRKWKKLKLINVQVQLM
jgi:hypothetical protein